MCDTRVYMRALHTRVSRRWLGSYLRTGIPPSTSVVLVSHDEALLESACDRIVEASTLTDWVHMCFWIMHEEK